MELLGPEAAAEGGTGEEELLPQPDGLPPAAAQEETAALGGDLLVEIRPDTDGRMPQNGALSPETDEPLDPSLVRLFLQARDEAEASDLPDIPIQDLLSELVSLSRSLGIERPPPAPEPTNGGEELPEAEEPPPSPETALPLQPEADPPPAVAGPRRHALHGLLLSLTLVLAIASVLVGAEHMISTTQNQEPTPSATVTVRAGVVVRQVHPTQSTPEPTVEASPAPTSARQPAYFIYTVRRGDTLTSIAAAFRISLDHIIWTNPDVIHDPNFLLVGDKLLIPSVAGLIYHLKPGDILSTLGRLLPVQAPDGSGPPPGQAQAP